MAGRTVRGFGAALVVLLLLVMLVVAAMTAGAGHSAGSLLPYLLVPLFLFGIVVVAEGGGEAFPLEEPRLNAAVARPSLFGRPPPGAHA